MSENDKKKECIGALLNVADTVAKRVIGAYDPNTSYKVNHRNLKALNSVPLEACATLLGFNVRDGDNKKLYKNLGVLSDRIILKIESLFEIICDECNDTYCNKLEDTPPLQCRLCMQGSHNCTGIVAKAEHYATNSNNNPFGTVWLCHECLKKNDLRLDPTIKTSQNKTAPLEDDKEEEEEDEIAEGEEHSDKEERESPRRGREDGNLAGNPSNKSNICELYKRRQCPHGRNGKMEYNGTTCNKNHPKRCKRYSNFGTHPKYGCSRGKDCRYWHPRLCRDSMKHKLCLKKDTCTFFHLKGTLRANPVAQEQADRFDQLTAKTDKVPVVKLKPAVPKMRSMSMSSAYTPYPPTIQHRPRPARDAKPDDPVNDSESFLMLIESMKEGIIATINDQIIDQMTELRSSIPELVRDCMISNNRAPPGAPPGFPQIPFQTFHQLSQMPITQQMMSMPNMMPHQYPVSSS